MKKKIKIFTCSLVALMIMVTPLVFAGCEKTNINSNIQYTDIRRTIIEDKQIKSVSYYGAKTESSYTTVNIKRMCTYRIDKVQLFKDSYSSIGPAKDVDITNYVFIAEEGLEFYNTISIPEFASQLGISATGYYGGSKVTKISYTLSVVETYKMDICFSDSLAHIFNYECVKDQFVSTQDLLENKDNEYYRFTETIRPADWVTEIVYQ